MDANNPNPLLTIASRVFARVADLSRLWPLVVVCIVTLWLIATPSPSTPGIPGTGIYNPSKVGILAWLLCKESALAYLGYWIDRLLHPNSRPSRLKDIDRMAAEKRRAFIVSALLLAGGLIQ